MNRIVGIDTWRWAQQPNCLWVEVRTESGVLGLGETFYTAGATEAVVHEMAAPLLLGRDAERITLHWRDLFACANFSGYAGAEMRAFSALDIALWDALGQTLQRPIYALLGGAVNERVQIYNSCVDAGGFTDGTRVLDEPVELMRELLDAGITAVKLWPFDRFAPQIKADYMTGPAGWSAMGPAGSHITPKAIAEGVRPIARLREEFGGDIEIIVEGHSRWDVPNAIRILRALEPYDVLWVEDILQPDSIDDLRRLVEETSVPQAVSERLFTKYAYRDVFERKAAHVAMLDVAWTGGISESSRIIDLADAYHLPVAPHDCTGPVTILANLHLCAAKPNIMITETVRGFYTGYYREVVDTPLPIHGGFATAPQRPGIGAALREDFKQRPDVTVRRSGA